jgi:hypothetical protein
MKRFAPAVTLLLSLIAAGPARAELRSLEIHRREPFADGQSFGKTGPYEIIAGVARFAVDPGNKYNQRIVDLALAPRNGDGKVEFEADVFILAPKDPARGNGAILYDVNNRGNKLALHFFNDAGGNNPRTAADAGNGFLFRHGFTVVWCGWIGELLPGGGRMLLRAPIATAHGKPIRGLVRYETTTNTPAESLPLSFREGHGSYPPTAEGLARATLTWRMRETDDRVLIPRGLWSLERIPIPKVEEGVPGTLGQIRLRVTGGLRPGYLYELICEAEGPIVQGLGNAAVRDLVSFLRYDDSKNNPLLAPAGKPAISRTHAFGVSQCGRFLRNFLYQAFNVDEKGRPVFDGLMPHVAGGGLGFFNFRFAQPTRHNAQHEEHLYPTDRFPFTYGPSTDPYSKRTDSILGLLTAESRERLPKVMHTQSAAEYWHRSGSLVHTDPLGKEDVPIPENVRIYAFGGTQHGPAGYPPQRGIGENLANPGDYRPFLRALLLSLDAWVKDGAAPPASVYPRIEDKTLVDWRQKSTGFPGLPGVRYPEVIQQPAAKDYGPKFNDGIITIEPPRILGQYVVLVPSSDPDGNDMGTLLPPEVKVPLATYTGWNLRRRDAGAEGMLVSLQGSYLPFARNRAERTKTGDQRISINERYGNFKEYQGRFAKTCADLVRQGYLLEEDVQRLVNRQERERVHFAPTLKE